MDVSQYKALHQISMHTYKLCLLVYKCLHRAALSYLVEQCVPITVNPARSNLSSAINHYLMYPRTNLIRYGPIASVSSAQEPGTSADQISKIKRRVLLTFVEDVKPCYLRQHTMRPGVHS